MITLVGHSKTFCDRISRRGFLQIGAAGIWTDLLRADAVSNGGRPKSLINICLPGGPSHIDTFDLKPEAPAEVRGEFRPISTVVPGFEICQHFPRLAAIADKFTVIRSICDFSGEHSTRQTDSGWPQQSLKDIGGRPGLGAVAAKMLAPIGRCPVTSVAMGGHTSPGYLGPSLKDFSAESSGRENLKLSLSESRLQGRAQLLAELDRFRREADVTGSMDAMDRFTQDAVDVVLSPRFSEALEGEREPRASRERYRGGDPKYLVGNNRIIVARRLIEAGVRVVSMTWGTWDTHGGNFTLLRRDLPYLDAGLSTLILDLEERGLLQDTIILMSGEFGRTPQVNANAGRDHWPAAGFAFVAGGGFNTGGAIGATDRLGAKPIERPLRLQQVYTAVARKMGLDPDHRQLQDTLGRPQYLFDHREPINELL